MSKDQETWTVKCSFCGKDKDKVSVIIAGPGVNICNECVDLCNEILDDASFYGTAGLICSFCRDSQEPEGTRRVISGAGVFICSPCVELCNGMVQEHRNATQEDG